MTFGKIVGAVFGFFAVIIALGVLLGSWYVVDEGQRAVILTNGKFSEVSGPGLHFKIPFFQSVKQISVRNEVFTVEKMEAYSYDQQPADVRLSVNVQVTDPELVYKMYGDLEKAINTIIYPRVFKDAKIVFGRYTAQREIQERDMLNNDVASAINKNLDNTGLSVISVQIEDIAFRQEYMDAINKVATAKASVEQAKNELAKVEVEAQQKVAQADAEAKAKKLQADADAYATEAAGRATANAITERGKALKDNPQLVGLVTAERWNGQLPTSMIPGNTVPFISLDNSTAPVKGLGQ